MDGRTLPVKFFGLRIRPYQLIQVSRFEFVRIESERRQITNAVMTGAGSEDVMENERAKSRIASGASPSNRHSLRIPVAARCQIAGRLNAIFNIDDSPCPVQ